MKTGLFLAESNVLHKYSAIIPRPILVIPKPNNKIDVNAGQPDAISLNKNFLKTTYIVHKKPNVKKVIPIKDTKRIGK